MKSNTFAATIVLAALLSSGAANAKGCLTGAAVGGVAGHVAGHHSVIGAGVGCAIGRHRANKKDKELAAQQARQDSAAANRPQAVQPVKK